ARQVESIERERERHACAARDLPYEIARLANLAPHFVPVCEPAELRMIARVRADREALRVQLRDLVAGHVRAAVAQEGRDVDAEARAGRVDDVAVAEVETEQPRLNAGGR